MTRIGSRFRRVEPRRRARAFVLGLLTELPRKNCWTIAEYAGDSSPDRMQHLLARAKWDADGVRDDVRGYVIEHLGDPGAVLVIDETGDIKKGTATPGVQRQYTGTAGRIENAQVAVYLGYAGPRGHALIDRELYLPKSWTDDRDRCAAAGIPATVTFATKPQLARRMIEQAAGAAVPFAWVAGDEVYGDNGPLRTWLETRRIAYVLAVACDHRVPAGAGRTLRADQLAARLPGKAWQRLSAGAGAKGHRWYDWAWVTINDPGPGHRCLLIRRNRSTGELPGSPGALLHRGPLRTAHATHRGTRPKQAAWAVQVVCCNTVFAASRDGCFVRWQVACTRCVRLLRAALGVSWWTR
jgi:SRSO17 transposase